MIEIPISQKYNLTIEEASSYFNIGQCKLREMIKENGCNFVLFVGKKALIKKEKLEMYLNNIVYL